MIRVKLTKPQQQRVFRSYFTDLGYGKNGFTKELATLDGDWLTFRDEDWQEVWERAEVGIIANQDLARDGYPEDRLDALADIKCARSVLRKLEAVRPPTDGYGCANCNGDGCEACRGLDKSTTVGIG